MYVVLVILSSEWKPVTTLSSFDSTIRQDPGQLSLVPIRIFFFYNKKKIFGKKFLNGCQDLYIYTGRSLSPRKIISRDTAMCTEHIRHESCHAKKKQYGATTHAMMHVMAYRFDATRDLPVLVI